jgi:hypothetical protein
LLPSSDVVSRQFGTACTQASSGTLWVEMQTEAQNETRKVEEASCRFPLRKQPVFIVPASATQDDRPHPESLDLNHWPAKYSPSHYSLK